MPVNFRYAMIDINGNSILVDKKAIAQAAKSVQAAVAKIDGLTTELLQKGFALQTPEGMAPVNLGSPADFATWVSKNLAGGSFDLNDSISSLPEPLNGGLKAVMDTEIIIYSAALFYTGDTGDTKTANKLYGELVIGFQVSKPSDGTMKDFPLALREIVIEVNNYPAPTTPAS